MSKRYDTLREELARRRRKADRRRRMLTMRLERQAQREAQRRWSTTPTPESTPTPLSRGHIARPEAVPGLLDLLHEPFDYRDWIEPAAFYLPWVRGPWRRK